jgi:chitinase
MDDGSTNLVPDNDKYSAHTALTGKSIVSNPSLKIEDKALSNPKSVVEDLSSWNGQKCFKYDGDCVNLNDNSAMSDACGSGYTVVGWDDAGCGTSSCVCFFFHQIPCVDLLSDL